MPDDSARRPDEPGAPKDGFAQSSHERDCEREQRLKALAERIVQRLSVAQLEALRERLRRFEDD